MTPDNPGPGAAPPANATGPATTNASAPVVPAETLPLSSLTPEEQMALFEKELKENDWGHQPC